MTRSGLVVVGHRSAEGVIPNPNPPLGTVGPNVGPGFGDTHVMYPASHPPPEVQHWDGWPVEWDVPNWNGMTSQIGKVSVVFACIDLNARIIGSMPIYLSRAGKVADPLTWMDNPAPGLYASWTDAVKQMIWTYQRRGEIILWSLARFADNSVARFAVLNPDLVDVYRDDRARIAYKLLGWEDGLFDDGRAYVADLDPADVLHIKYAVWPGELRGHSPLEAVAANWFAAVNAQTFAGDLTARGGIPWGVLNAPYEVTEPEVDRLRAQWLDHAARRGGAPAITSGGFTLTGLTITPAEMALLEQRQFDESRIAVALGAQPFQVGLPQGNSMTYSNVESIFDYHWRATLRPFTREISGGISPWAIPGRSNKMLFNPDAYVRPGFEGRSRAYQALHGLEDETGRAITAEEIRSIEQIDGDEASAIDAGQALEGV
jgi:HK97 family phage portal protein